ncbi:hypothetical protein AMTRI_Chr03g47710 [Amborella trichopoda]
MQIHRVVILTATLQTRCRMTQKKPFPFTSGWYVERDVPKCRSPVIIKVISPVPHLSCSGCSLIFLVFLHYELLFLSTWISFSCPGCIVLFCFFSSLMSCCFHIVNETAHGHTYTQRILN